MFCKPCDRERLPDGHFARQALLEAYSPILGWYEQKAIATPEKDLAACLG